MDQTDSKHCHQNATPPENQETSILGMLGSVLGAAFDRIDGVVEWLRDTPPHKVPMATYEEVIGYFVEHRPESDAVEKGAILRRQTKQGIELTQLFLNAANQPVPKPDGGVYGRKLLADSLDKDLHEAFGNNSTIIFE